MLIHTTMRIALTHTSNLHSLFESSSMMSFAFNIPTGDRMGQRYLSLLLMMLVSASNLLGAATVDVRLIDAIKKSDVKAVNALLNQKIDVNAKSADGTTALHWAVNEDNLEAAKALIAAGANVKAANDYGITPLTFACIHGRVAMVAAL